MSKIDDAIGFAAFAHANQRRKYSGEPYIFHPLEVYRILVEHGIEDEDIHAAAVLHDVVEDCGVSIATLERRFGPKVAAIVFDLTEPEGQGNRAERKRQEAERLWTVCEQAQTVKGADFISNTRSIVDHDLVFAKVYLPEKREALRGMTLMHPAIRKTAEASLLTGFAALEMKELLHE